MTTGNAAWVMRGGHYSHTMHAGLFDLGRHDGTVNGGISFRATILVNAGL
jgi:hypothetical protein